jgi:regulator of cell morphogenesis and NO signaling
MNVTTETRVGQLAAEHPLATRVLARHGIDFCCGGGRPLGEVCREKGLDSTAVLDEIRNELKGPGESVENWNTAPLDDLIEHILFAYHRPLREELPRLESMARKVRDVHGSKDPERFAQLLSVFAGLKDELLAHMAKEEMVLFPLIKQGSGPMADGPISVMEHEHDSAAAALRRLRALTDDYRVPPEACNTWRALWHGLAALEESLHEHIHLENNILFPRALVDSPAAGGD